MCGVSSNIKRYAFSKTGLQWLWKLVTLWLLQISPGSRDLPGDAPTQNTNPQDPDGQLFSEMEEDSLIVLVHPVRIAAKDTHTKYHSFDLSRQTSTCISLDPKQLFQASRKQRDPKRRLVWRWNVYGLSGIGSVTPCDRLLWFHSAWIIICCWWLRCCFLFRGKQQPKGGCCNSQRLQILKLWKLSYFCCECCHCSMLCSFLQTGASTKVVSWPLSHSSISPAESFWHKVWGVYQAQGF